MKNLTASDRESLIKLASSLPQGDETRKAILAGLKVVGSRSISVGFSDYIGDMQFKVKAHDPNAENMGPDYVGIVIEANKFKTMNPKYLPVNSSGLIDVDHIPYKSNPTMKDFVKFAIEFNKKCHVIVPNKTAAFNPFLGKLREITAIMQSDGNPATTRKLLDIFKQEVDSYERILKEEELIRNRSAQVSEDRQNTMSMLKSVLGRYLDTAKTLTPDEVFRIQSMRSSL